MKKTELQDCPQWLMDADTHNENVEWVCGPKSYVVWLGGQFRGGEFRGGQFLGGQFLGGEFRGGATACKSCYIPVILESGKIKVGCKAMTAKEWADWLAGSEEFNTPRNTEAFRMIRAHILATIAYQAAMNEYEVNT